MKKMKKIITLMLAAILTLSLCCCGKEKDGKKEDTDYGPGSNVITSAKIGDTYCKFDAYKNPGGQETGAVFKILIPKEKVSDKKNVEIEITLADEWKISDESNCIVSIANNSLVLDLSVDDPQLIAFIESNSYKRTYHLVLDQ